MTDRIYKYRLEVIDEQEIELPKGAQILTLQTQHGVPHLWAVVNDGEPLSKRRFLVRGTGHEMGQDIDGLRYIGTFQLMDGDLVFHVFEVF